jgi:hypothetical protein
MLRPCVFTGQNSHEQFLVDEDMSEKVFSEKGELPSLVDLKIQVPQELYIAYQRCSWIIVHETGRKPLDVMQEMVRDFLVKHGC